MKHTITFIFAAILFNLSALAQPKEIKVTVDGMDIELVRIEPGTVTLPERSAYTLGKDPQTGKWVYSYKDPMTGLYQVVSESLTLPESTQIISEAYYIMKYPVTRAQWGLEQKGKKATMPITMSYSIDDGIDNNYDTHAVPFIKKLKQKTGLDWALPSLGEWLLACGPIPENVEEYAWIDGGTVHEVGLKKLNANGAYDMLGGLAEMVEKASYEQDGKLVIENPRYVGGIPVMGAKAYKKDPSKLLEWMSRAPVSSMWPPTLRLVLKGIPEDSPGILKMQIVKEGNKYGLETEYGMVLKPEYDVVKMVEMDSELAAGGGFLASKNGEWGVFNRRGETLLPMIFVDEKTVMTHIPYLEFVSYSYNYKQEVKRISATKGEYEKTAHFEARKADPALQKAYVESQMKDFEQRFIGTIINDKRTVIAFRDYDADKEVFPFIVANARTLWTTYELPVPIDAAPAFSEYIKSANHQELLQSAQWGIVDDCAQILQITFTLPDGRSYTYSR
ncbi:MAG: hypothetical protein IJ687_04980 [Bacteroidales bacterium]|nr:hypothetical protein [Bacteroidales bacterium]